MENRYVCVWGNLGYIRHKACILGYLGLKIVILYYLGTSDTKKGSALLKKGTEATRARQLKWITSCKVRIIISVSILLLLLLLTIIIFIIIIELIRENHMFIFDAFSSFGSKSGSQLALSAWHIACLAAADNWILWCLLFDFLFTFTGQVVLFDLIEVQKDISYAADSAA